MGKYDSILNLPYYKSARHPHMPQEDRAAQFAPFAALRGYDETLQEAGRVTETPAQLAEDEKNRLDSVFREIREHLPAGPVVYLTYFQPDPIKPGGVYLEKCGVVQKIDDGEKLLIFAGGDAVCWEAVRQAEVLLPGGEL